MTDASAAATARPSFEDLCRPHVAFVWHSLRRLGIPAAQLVEATHDVFVAAHRAYPSFDAALPVRPWLFVHAMRVFARRPTEAKHDDRAAPFAVETPPPAGDTTDPDPSRVRVIEALRAIDIDRRAVIILHDIDEVPLEDIARALDVPVKSLRARLRIAREDLAAALKR
ncbi:MAG: RNA polymerase sigma factor [Deltaproteobacteria bacterium]